MKPARLIAIGITVLAGGAAFMFSGRAPQLPAQIVQAAPAVDMEDVLVAKKEILLGTLVTEAEIAWASWPKSSTSPAMIRKSDSPTGFEDAKGSVVRGNFFEGEPIRKEKLVKGPNSGFMSAILPSGRRAVSIDIDGGGKTSAGGFILPEDHVDVVRTYRDDEATKASGTETYGTQTILRNIRVLAIGQNIQEEKGKRVVVGSNATLELDPAQVELIILGQRTGQLSLALRAKGDSNANANAEQAPGAAPQDKGGFTIVRAGIAAQSAKR